MQIYVYYMEFVDKRSSIVYNSLSGYRLMNFIGNVQMSRCNRKVVKNVFAGED